VRAPAPELGRTLRFVIDGRAVPAGSKQMGVTKTGRRFIHDDSGRRGTNWRNEVVRCAAVACMELGWPLSPVPFAAGVALHVTMRFEFHRAKRPAPGLELWPLKPPDVLKVARGIEDALSRHLWADDDQIVSEYLCKRYGPSERVVVIVSELL
jgi:Holliday junction resolvase RusA-like endonuclease